MTMSIHATNVKLEETCITLRTQAQMDVNAMRNQVGTKYQTSYSHALVLMDIWTRMATASAVINCFPVAQHVSRNKNRAKTPFMLVFMTTCQDSFPT